MPIRELTRYRITCDQCGAHEDYEATQQEHVPPGWVIDRSSSQYTYHRITTCPACSEQRKDERND